MEKIRSAGWGSWAVLGLFLICQECMGGVIVEQVVKDKNGIPLKVILSASDSQCRTDAPEKGLSTILNFKEDRLMMIDHRSKRYVDVKLSEWEKETAGRLKEEFHGMKSKEKKISVKKTGQTSVMNGFQTEKVNVMADGELIEENWVTRDIDLKELEEVMGRASGIFSKDFQSEMKQGREIYEKVKSYGYPVLIKDYSSTYGLAPIDRVEVKKIEKKELKDEAFLPPAGYQKIIPEPSKKE